MRKLGTDRPDLMLRFLDEDFRKHSTHFFRQLGRGRSVEDAPGKLAKERPKDLKKKAL